MLNAIKNTCQLTTLNIDKNDICSRSCRYFADTIYVCLINLSMMSCNIDDEAAQSIGEGLQRHSHIKVLNLSQNNIRDEGGKAIGEALLR